MFQLARKHLVLTLFCFGMLALAGCICVSGLSRPQAEVIETEKEILKLLQLRLNAVVAGDVASLDAMLAPEFRYIGIHGSMRSREAYLQSKRTSMNT